LGKDVTYERLDGAGHDFSQQYPELDAVMCDWLAAQLKP
jgi:hypothetical protein